MLLQPLLNGLFFLFLLEPLAAYPETKGSYYLEYILVIIGSLLKKYK